MALKLRHVLAAAGVAFVAATLFSDGVKTDPESVRKYALERIAAQFRDARVSSLEPSEFEIVHPNGRRAIGNLRAAEETCQTTPSKCIDAIDDLLIGLLDWLEADAPLKPEALRPVITTRAALERTAVTPAEGDSTRPIATPLAGTLVVGYQIVNANSSMALTEGLRQRLSIAAESIEAAALAALESTTPEPTVAAVFGGLGIHELRGPSAAAQLLHPARRGAILRMLRARTLLVAQPAAGQVLVVDADNVEGAALLESMAARMFKEARRALTPEILVVSASGWSAR